MSDRYRVKHVGLHVFVMDNEADKSLTDYPCDYHCYPIDVLVSELNSLNDTLKATERDLKTTFAALPKQLNNDEEHLLQLEF